MVIEDAFSRNHVRQVAEWVRTNRIDAVLSDHDQGLEILTGGGFRVPGEVGLACLSVTSVRAVAGIDPQFAEMGRAGLSLLHSLVTGSDLGVAVRASRLLLAGAWIDGDSLPCRAG